MQRKNFVSLKAKKVYYVLIDLMKETCNQVLIQRETCSVIPWCNAAMLLHFLKIRFRAFKLAFYLS